MLPKLLPADSKIHPWLFIALFSLALFGFGLVIIQLRLPDSVIILFAIPVLFAAFTFRRWVAWLSLLLLFSAALVTSWILSDNFAESLKTIVIITLCESVVVEVICRIMWMHRNAEENLRASEQKYKSLIEQIPIGVYRTDNDGTFLHVNHTLARMLGFDDPEMLIHKYKVQNFCVDTTMVEQQRQDYLSAGIRVHEMQLRRQDGALIWIRDSANPIYKKNGDVLHVDGTVENITQRKRIEEELERERNLLRTLIDNLPDRIYAKNERCEKVLSNPADWTSIGATSEQEVLGKTDFDLMSPNLASRFWSDDQQVLQSGTALVNRVEPGPSPFGEECWVLTTKVPLRDANGHVIGLVGVGRDITERRQIEEALHRANEKLTEWVNVLEQRNREARLLNDMGELLQSCHSVEDAYEVIGQLGERMFEQQNGALYIINNSHSLMEMVSTWGNLDSSAIGERVAGLEDCWALRRGRVHLVASSGDRLRCKHLGEISHQPAETSFLSFICVPMIAQGETLGMVHVRFSSPEQAKQNEQLVIAMSERAAMALANLKLSETLRAQAVRDPLTGLFNRRYMEETLDREIRRAIRYQRPLGVIMLDIDHFKQFNDTFSYAAGDTLLREMGIALKTNLRADDVTCRYGGEEFILILPESSLEDTSRRAEQLRTACKSMHVEHRGQPLGVITISLGVAAYPEHGENADNLLRAVDTALHSAKSGGRDQVIIAAANSNKKYA
jgi:diguanylate cyclase (GGDEF)-like protein/PAS domain S-box-containing protein